MMLYELDEIEKRALGALCGAGFSVVKDGGAVIVIGKADQIPIDRPVGAHDLAAKTRARRFDSAQDAARTLVDTEKGSEQ